MSERVPIFVGIDLAWVAHNPSGVAVVREGCLVAHHGALGDDEEIVAFLQPWLGVDAARADGGAVVAVDAPLRVPNETGGRRCDRELSRAWSWAQAGAYNANRRNLARDGIVRGEALVARLGDAFGCVEATAILAQPGARYVCEVYPHPAMIALFGLDRTLKYKHGPRAERLQAFERYQALLAGLEFAEPSLVGLEDLLAEDVAHLRGRQLQAYEETLDAVLCAYIASYLWQFGPAQTHVYGAVTEGHILVPTGRADIPLSQGVPAKPARRLPPAPAASPNAETQSTGADTLNARIGVLTRREVEARILGPVIEALAAEFDRERVHQVLAQTIVRIAREQGADLAHAMGGSSLTAFADSLQYWTQDNALEIELLEQSDTQLDFNVTRCRYAELYRALDLAELGAVLSCNRDYALVEGFNAQVELSRTQTIMEGAPFCNFRYRLGPGETTAEGAE